MKKILIIFVMMQISTLIACTAKDNGSKHSDEETTIKIFTVQELSGYDGKDGRRA